MNINEIEKIIPKEKILQNVQMKKYTSFKIGGEAEVLIKISTLEELTKIIKYIKQKNIQTFILGNGSNLLVSDEGIKKQRENNKYPIIKGGTADSITESELNNELNSVVAFTKKLLIKH